MSYLGEGDLARARAYLAAVPGSVEPADLAVYMANYQDLGWVLTEEQKDLLLRLTPAAFDDDRGTWGICLAQILWWRGDVAGARKYAEEARKAMEEQLRAAPNDPGRHASLGLALAYLGRADEAIREGQRALELGPVEKDLGTGPYFLHQLVRIYILAGQPEKAIDGLERLLKTPLLGLSCLADDRSELRSAAREPAVSEADRENAALTRRHDTSATGNITLLLYDCGYRGNDCKFVDSVQSVGSAGGGVSTADLTFLNYTMDNNARELVLEV